MPSRDRTGPYGEGPYTGRRNPVKYGMKFIVNDPGDPSVGISGGSWEVDINDGIGEIVDYEFDIKSWIWVPKP